VPWKVVPDWDIRDRDDDGQNDGWLTEVDEMSGACDGL